jgi:hypothetical protein
MALSPLDDYVTANLLADPARSLAARLPFERCYKICDRSRLIFMPGHLVSAKQLDYEGVAILLRQDPMQPIVPPDVTRKDDHV